MRARFARVHEHAVLAELLTAHRVPAAANRNRFAGLTRAADNAHQRLDVVRPLDAAHVRRVQA
jgi:hypothetical protein